MAGRCEAAAGSGARGEPTVTIRLDPLLGVFWPRALCDRLALDVGTDGAFIDLPGHGPGLLRPLRHGESEETCRVLGQAGDPIILPARALPGGGEGEVAAPAGPIGGSESRGHSETATSAAPQAAPRNHEVSGGGGNALPSGHAPNGGHGPSAKPARRRTRPAQPPRGHGPDGPDGNPGDRSGGGPGLAAPAAASEEQEDATQEPRTKSRRTHKSEDDQDLRWQVAAAVTEARAQLAAASRDECWDSLRAAGIRKTFRKARALLDPALTARLATTADATAGDLAVMKGRLEHLLALVSALGRGDAAAAQESLESLGLMGVFVSGRAEAAVFRVAVGAAAREKVDEKTRQLLSERPPWFTDAHAWQRAQKRRRRWQRHFFAAKPPKTTRVVVSFSRLRRRSPA